MGGNRTFAAICTKVSSAQEAAVAGFCKLLVGRPKAAVERALS